MRKFLKRLGLLIAAPFFVVTLYLLAALIGGLIPSNTRQALNVSPLLEKPVYLTYNALHADIAIPLNSFTLEQFSFLKNSGFALDNPNLQYLIIGWGARDFYTSTAEYSDIKFATALKAITGDDAVMRVAPAGDVGRYEGVIRLDVSEQGLIHMVEFILESFKRRNGDVVPLEGVTFGFGDLFYEAQGTFNVFNPCNVWVSQALAKAGVSTGVWTPTTYGLQIHHALYH